jgi:hypothetical protein
VFRNTYTHTYPNNKRHTQIKLKKDGSAMWQEVHELAALLRSGQFTW